MEEEIQIKKRICEVKQELSKGYVSICQGCGSKMPPKACYCPQCGNIIGE